jgi:predicted GIY-YIG superfamily endonuclease
MLKDYKRWPFTQAMLEYAPDNPGVYVLWDGDEAIYIGRAQGKESVKKRLLAHHAGSLGECTMKATYYSWAISVWPASMETELFAEFHRQHKRDPRCHGKAA